MGWTRPGVPGADGVEESDERQDVTSAEAAEGFLVCRGHDGIELREKAEAAAGDMDEDAPAVPGAAPALDEPFGLEAIQQARDARSLLDHAVSDLEGGEARRSRPVEDPEDVVLLAGNAVGLHDLGEAPSREVRGPQQGEEAFLLGARERLRLAYLALHRARRLHHRERLRGNH
jgi:hypothetical protein